jgi:hypothetical protein
MGVIGGVAAVGGAIAAVVSLTRGKEEEDEKRDGQAALEGGAAPPSLGTVDREGFGGSRLTIALEKGDQGRIHDSPIYQSQSPTMGGGGPGAEAL